MITRDEIVSVSANVIDCAPSTVETELDVNDATGTYDGSTDLSATLTANGSGVSGKDIDFMLNGNNVGSATTDGDGVATLSNVSLSGINAGSYPSGVGASFAGDSAHESSSGSASLDVAKAAQTIDFGALANKTYGDPSFDVSATASSGLPVSFSTVSSLNVCSIDGNTVTIEGAGDCTIRASQGGDVNYNAAPNVDQTFTVDKATATITLSDLNHTYDGNPKSATVATNPSGLSGVTVTYDGSSTPPTDAGEYDVVASLSHPNYQASNATGTLVISKASATINLSDLSHTYDGNPKSATATTDPEGLDTVTITYDGSTNLPVGAGSYAVEASLDNPNYTATPATGTLIIDPKEVTGSFTANNKEYDGNTGATVASSDLSGIEGDDDVSLVVSNVHFDSATSGTGKAVTADLSLSGDDADNYVLASTTASTTADITAKSLTISGAVVQNKVYDGNAGATVDFSGASLVEVVPGDDVSIDSSGYAASFDNADVGSGKPVTVSGVALDGDDSGNYTVSQPSDLTADITEKNLSISGAVANNKVYDGNTTASVDFSNASLNGVVGTDDVSIDSSGYSASFADANVDDDINVTVTGVTLSGADAGNYTVSQPSGLSADITPKNLTITGAEAQNKTYDGNATATVDFSNASLDGVVGNDDVQIDSSGYSASFDDKNVGLGTPVTVNGVTLSSDDAGNYTVSQPVGLTADINPLTITGSFTTANKVYDGNTNATIAVRLLSGVLGDDDVALVGGTATFDDANVGTGKTVTGIGFSLDGADAGNYVLESTTLTTTANITARPIEVTADPQTKVYGEDDPALTYQITNGTLVGDDEFTGALSREAGEDVGTYAIEQGTLALSSNYALAYAGADFTITQRPITVTADDQTKVYGDADPALTHRITSGTLAYSDAFTGNLTREAGEDVGDYAIQQGTLALNDNYDLTFVEGTLTVIPRPITVKASDVTRTYGEPTPAFSIELHSGTLGHDDELSDLGTPSFGTDPSPATNVGTYRIDVSGLSNDNYTIGYATGDDRGVLTIAPRAITIKAHDVTRTYGESTPVFNIGIHAGSLADGDTLMDLDTPVFTTDPADAKDVGIYRIDVTGLVNGNYDISYAEGDDRGLLTIVPRSITIKANDVTRTYGESTPVFSVAVHSGSFGHDDDLSDLGTPSFDTDPSPAVNVGTYRIDVSDLSNNNYDISYATGDDRGLLTIVQRPITVTADPQTKIYGEADPALTYQVTDGNLVDGDTFTGSLTRDAGQDVGTYAITQGSLTAGPNYALTYVGDNLTIIERPITVTADDQFKLLGDADPDLTWTITSGSLAYNDEVTGQLEREPGEEVGTYQIQQDTLGLSDNYDLTFEPGTLTIGYNVCVDFNDEKSKKAGSTVPVRIALCDIDGNNVSSSDVQVHAYQMVKTSISASSEIDPEDAGNANPDDDFRFAGDRYVYNLQTKGMSQGTWHLKFKVDGVQHLHYYVVIQIKK